MKAVLFIIVCAAVFTSKAHGRRFRRYVGGNEAKRAQFPYLASLRRVTTKEHFCGGSIIHQQYVLTAGHCVDDKDRKDFYVVAGTNLVSSLRKRHLVDKFSLHVHYDSNKTINDIALIRLRRPFQLSKYIKKISLPAPAFDTPIGVIMTTIGFGRTHYNANNSQTLQYSNVTTISLKQCTKMISKVIKLHYITSKHICTFDPHKGFCKGDSGGPLVYHGKQVGIVSWMIGTCARGYPDVYVKVAPYVKWIERTVDKWKHKTPLNETKTKVDKPKTRVAKSNTKLKRHRKELTKYTVESGKPTTDDDYDYSWDEDKM